MKIGVGFDAHRFDDSRRLVIGGVAIDLHPGLAGHSDGDVLSHAVADAVLGAAGLGDLGTHFPGSSTPEGISSIEILKRTVGLVAGSGLRVVNLDSTVIVQDVPITPHRDDMQKGLARALQILPGSVSVKGTTTDEMGFTGRGEGAAAIAVVLLTEAEGAGG